VVEQVAELVEDGLDLAVREQGGLALHRRGHVAAHQADVRLAGPAGDRRQAGAQRVHPRAAALRLARVPVGEEAAAQAAVPVEHLEVPHLGVPRLGGPRRGGAARLEEAGGPAFDADAEEALAEPEHAVDHAVHREVRPQHLVVEVELGLAPAFGPEGGVPRFEWFGGHAEPVGPPPAQIGLLAGEGGLDAVVQAFDEAEGGLAVLGHAALEHEVGEIPLA